MPRGKADAWEIRSAFRTKNHPFESYIRIYPARISELIPRRFLRTKRATAIPLSQATIVCQAHENIPALRAIRETIEGQSVASPKRICTRWMATWRRFLGDSAAGERSERTVKSTIIRKKNGVQYRRKYQVLAPRELGPKVDYSWSGIAGAIPFCPLIFADCNPRCDATRDAFPGTRRTTSVPYRPNGYFARPYHLGFTQQRRRTRSN